MRPERSTSPAETVAGTVEIVKLHDAMELLVDYFRRVGGEHDDWDDYREAMRREQRVLPRVELTAAGPDRAGRARVQEDHGRGAQYAVRPVRRVGLGPHGVRRLNAPGPRGAPAVTPLGLFAILSGLLSVRTCRRAWGW